MHHAHQQALSHAPVGDPQGPHRPQALDDVENGAAGYHQIGAFGADGRNRRAGRLIEPPQARRHPVDIVERQAQAIDLSLKAMLTAARELIRVQWQDVPDDTAIIVSEFRKRFYDNKLFFDPYAGGKFAVYLLRAIENPLTDVSSGKVHRLVEEAQLFIEAAYACSNRMDEQQSASA